MILIRSRICKGLGLVPVLVLFTGSMWDQDQFQNQYGFRGSSGMGLESIPGPVQFSGTSIGSRSIPGSWIGINYTTGMVSRSILGPE